MTVMKYWDGAADVPLDGVNIIGATTEKSFQVRTGENFTVVLVESLPYTPTMAML